MVYPFYKSYTTHENAPGKTLYEYKSVGMFFGRFITLIRDL